MIQIKQSLIPAKTNSRSGKKLRKVSGVTIHNTGNYSNGAGAYNHMRYQTVNATGYNNYLSYHYVIDDKECYRLLPETEVSWHAGDGTEGKGNNETISIEICVNPESNLLKATDRAVELAADILKRNGLTEKNLYQHYDWNQKNCPAEIRKGNPYGWTTFKSKVAAILKPAVSPKPTEGDKMYKIQIGAYSVKANADRALKEAIAKGYKDAYIVDSGSVTKPSEPIKPAPKPVTKEYVQLSKEVTTGWRVYPLNKEPVVKNAIGSLQPHKFGGLEYEILARPMTDLVTIQTRDWGKVNIYIGKETAHKIVRK